MTYQKIPEDIKKALDDYCIIPGCTVVFNTEPNIYEGLIVVVNGYNPSIKKVTIEYQLLFQGENGIQMSIPPNMLKDTVTKVSLNSVVFWSKE